MEKSSPKVYMAWSPYAIEITGVLFFTNEELAKKHCRETNRFLMEVSPIRDDIEKETQLDEWTDMREPIYKDIKIYE